MPDDYSDEKRGPNRHKISEEAKYAIDQLLDRQASHSCCVLNPEAKEAAPKFFAKLKDAGQGKMERGINIRDDDAKYWHVFRKINRTVFDILLKVVVVGAGGWFLYDRFGG